MSTDIPMKLCSRCQQEFPLTTEYWYQRKNGYWQTPCKHCSCAMTRANYAAKAEQKRAYARDHYAALPPEERQRRLELKRIYGRTWYIVNAGRKRATELARYMADPVKARAKAVEAALRWQASHPEQVRAANKAYYAANKDRECTRSRAWQAAHPEHRKEVGRVWRAKNPEKVRTQSTTRRARKLGAEGSFTDEDIKRIYAEQGGKCAYCSTPIWLHIKGNVHIDHIQPLSRGGTNYPENLACACKSCNSSKHNKTPEEWIAMRGW